jgi:hypothetical protein
VHHEACNKHSTADDIQCGGADDQRCSTTGELSMDEPGPPGRGRYGGAATGTARSVRRRAHEGCGSAGGPESGSGGCDSGRAWEPVALFKAVTRDVSGHGLLPGRSPACTRYAGQPTCCYVGCGRLDGQDICVTRANTQGEHHDP